MQNITNYQNNLVAKLLEDRAYHCLCNAMDCEDANVQLVAVYWMEQKDIASNLALQFREAGKD